MNYGLTPYQVRSPALYKLNMGNEREAVALIIPHCECQKGEDFLSGSSRSSSETFGNCYTHWYIEHFILTVRLLSIYGNFSVSKIGTAIV